MAAVIYALFCSFINSSVSLLSFLFLFFLILAIFIDDDFKVNAFKRLYESF